MQISCKFSFSALHYSEPLYLCETICAIVSVRIFTYCRSHCVLDNTFYTYFFSTIKVINVRNSAMHSPDLKISKEDMNRHHNTVLQLAKLLEPKIPKLKDLEKKITQVDGKLIIHYYLLIKQYYHYLLLE